MQSHLNNNFTAIFFGEDDPCWGDRYKNRRHFDVPESVLKEERRRPLNIINQEVLDTLCRICFVAGECNCEQQEESSSE